MSRIPTEALIFNLIHYEQTISCIYGDSGDIDHLHVRVGVF